MSSQDGIKFKVDSTGEVDITYYVDRGHQLRAEYFREVSVDTKSWFTRHFNLEWLKNSFASLAHH